MLTNDQSEPTGWDSLPPEPSDPPFGLPFFHGEKVSVSFGRPEPGRWGMPHSDRVRLVFSLNQSWGLIETNWGGVEIGPSWLLEPHRLCMISPELEVTVHSMRKTELVVLYLESTAFGKCGQLPWDFSGRDLRLLARRDPSLARLAQIFLTLCRQPARPEPEFVEGIGTALASQAMAHYFSPEESSPKVRSGLPLDTIDQITNYVDAHPSEAILASDLARQVGLSPDHFARRFKTTTGTSPKQFVLGRRMEKVEELLRTGKYNVTEAGREVGFHDPSHLNRCFRKRFGYPPIEVRKGALASTGRN